MNANQWTVALAAAGLVTLPSMVSGQGMMEPLTAAISDVSIGGYVNTSAHWNMGTGNVNPPAYSYNRGKQDGFNLNAVALTIDRPVGPEQWAAGYRADLVFGPDAKELGTQFSGSSTDFAVQQAYVALRAPAGNGLDFKLGVFDKIIGYEEFAGGRNANYTRSYGYSIEPTTHTGALMSYQFCDYFAASAGVANTYGPGINSKAHLVPPPLPSRAESYKTYMGSVAFIAPESWGFLAGSTLYGGVINGFNTVSSVTFDAAYNQTSWYVGGTINTPIEGLRFGLSYDYAGVHDDSSAAKLAGTGGALVPELAGTSAYAYAAALYGSFQATEKLSLHARGEYASRSPFSDPAVNSQISIGRGSFIPGVMPSKVFAVTGTAQYDLWKNVISRVEFRWDHAADGDLHFSGESQDVGGPGGVRGPTRKNAYLLALNVIYQF